jgi:hypothetical protein
LGVKGGAYHFVDCSVVFGVDFFAVGIQLFIVELSQVEEMAGFEFIVPGFAYPGLVQQEGLFAPWDALVLMVLDLPEEGGEDFGVVFASARRNEPPAKEVDRVHELLPRELFVG